MSLQGNVFDIQRFSIHDGPGIRTTVFLKGCPLRCLWCHNPESNLAAPQLSFTASRCIGCGACLKACTHGAHDLNDKGEHIIHRDTCVVCGACAKTCYAEALEIIGKKMSVDEVIQEVAKDAPFYATSGGGMTLSGGEPLFQPEFSLACLEEAKRHTIGTAMETSGFAPWNVLERFIPLVDHFMFDVKETDETRHKHVTGVPMAQIQQNLHKLHDTGKPLLVRFPLVPNVNATPEHFAGIAMLAKTLPHARFEIMPYHRLGEGKLERLGQAVKADDYHPVPPENALFNQWLDEFAAQGVTMINTRK